MQVPTSFSLESFPLSQPNAQSDYVKRFKLGLSKTVSTIVVPGSSIITQPDWTATCDCDKRVDAESIGIGGQRIGDMVMTEGCGFISTEAMEAVALLLGLVTETPSVIQARIGSAKGLWLRWDAATQGLLSGDSTDRQREDGDETASKGWSIIVRPSQLKFELTQPDEHQRAVEVCDFSSERDNKPSNMNKHIIRILHQRGVPLQIFEALQDEEVERVRAKMKGADRGWVMDLARAWGQKDQRRRRGHTEAKIGDSTMAGNAVSTRDNLGSIVCELLDAGFAPTDPLLKGPVARIIRGSIEDKLCMGSGLVPGHVHDGPRLKRRKKGQESGDSISVRSNGVGGGGCSSSDGDSNGASNSDNKWGGYSLKMRMPVEFSRTFLIAPDPTRTLLPGQCAVRLGTHGDMLTGAVVFARHPIYYHTCLRVATAVDVPALRHLPNDDRNLHGS